MNAVDKIVVTFMPADNWYERSKWQLEKPYTSANGEVTVHAKFLTDGASIPFFARFLFSSTGKYFGAAIVHDYVLNHNNDRDQADIQFDLEMRAIGIVSWRRNILVKSVRLWSRFLKLIGKH